MFRRAVLRLPDLSFALSSHRFEPRVSAADRGLAVPYRASVMAAVIIYVFLGWGSALTKLPICDEGWYANPAFNLSAGRPMATTVLESAGTPLHGLDQHTYWVMPLYIVGQAWVEELFGRGLVQARLLSLAWGVAILISWFMILRALFEDKYIALIGMFVMAIDSYMIAVGSTARSDMMCAGLGSAGLAAYLTLRPRRLALALLTGNALVAASGLTHPNGILYLACLLFLVWSFDRQNIRALHVAAAAAPYVIGAAIWGVYILQNPTDFIAQFGGNARVRASGMSAPLMVIKREALRYMNAYGLAPDATGLSRIKAVMLLAYCTGIAGVVLTPRLRRQPSPRILLCLLAIVFVLMLVAEGAKQDWYLVHIIPLFGALLAVWVVDAARHRVVPAAALVCVMGAFVLVNVGVVGTLLHRADYQHTYLPVVQFLRNPPNDRARVMGSAELGFQIGFDRLTDDTRLGFYSGKQADLVVVEATYEGWFQKHQLREPAVYRHVRATLTNARKVFDNGRYRVYAVGGR